MAITLVANSSGNLDNTSSVAVAKPTGTAEFDVIIAMMSIDGTAKTALPSGFTTIQATDTAGSHGNIIGYKIAGASEPSTYTFAPASGSERAWCCLATYRGVDNVSPINGSNTNTTASSSTATLSSITPSVDNCAVIGFIGFENGRSGGTLVNSTTTGLTVQNNNVNGPPGTGAASSSGAFADIIQTTAAAVSGTFTCSTSSNNGAMAVVLTPAATTGISTVTPSTFQMDASSVVSAGSNFQSTQTTGTIYLSDATTLAGSLNEVDVSSAVTAWNDTSITLNLTNLSNAEIADLVALGAGARHVIVLTSAADEYNSPVTLQDAPAVVMSLGAGTDGASTSRLTGMTGTFTAGRFTETANPSATTTDIVADGHTEMVFSVELTAYAEDAADYEFRLLPGGAVPGTITQTPTVTVGAGGTTTPKSIVSTAVGSATVTDALILGQTVSATSVGSVVLDTLSTFSRAIAVVTNSIPTLDRLGTYLKTIAVTATATPTVDTIKTINQAIVATAIGVMALATQLITSISQSITATANGVVTFANALTLSAVINATAIGVVTIPKTVYKSVVAIATGDMTQIKTVYKSIFVFAVGFVDVSRVVYKEIAVIAIGLPIALAQIAVSQGITAVAVGVANISTSIIVYVGRVSNKIYVMFRTVFSNIFSNKG